MRFFHIFNFTSVGASIGEPSPASHAIDVWCQGYPGIVTFIIIGGYILSILVLNLVYALRNLEELCSDLIEEEELGEDILGDSRNAKLSMANA